MNKTTMGLVLLGALGAAMAVAQSTIPLFLNGKAASRPVLLVNGERYVSLSALKSAGAEVKEARGRIDVNFSAPTLAGAQGTTQLSGADAKVNQAYSVGQRSPLNFTLKSAELSLASTAIGTNPFTTTSTQKLLLVRFSVQNPQKNDVELSTTSYRFTVVDSRDVNVSPEPFGSPIIARNGETDALRVQLKPAQRVDAYAVFVVSGQGTLPKLIVQRTGEEKAPVLRYDLRPILKGLRAPFADASDPTTALERVQGQPGTYYPTYNLDVKFEGAQFGTDTVAGANLKEGNRWLWVTYSLRNPYPKTSDRNVSYGECSVTAELLDANDERVTTQQCGTPLYRPSRPERLPGGELRPGDEVKVRMLFELPTNVGAKSFSLRGEDKGRTYTFDLSGVR
jgi:hypothetical protein